MGRKESRSHLLIVRVRSSSVDLATFVENMVLSFGSGSRGWTSLSRSAGSENPGNYSERCQSSAIKEPVGFLAMSFLPTPLIFINFVNITQGEETLSLHAILK